MHVKTDKPPSSRMKRTNGNGQVHLPGPGHPAPRATTAAAAQTPKPTGPGHPASSPDIRPQPRNPTKSLDIRRHAREHPKVLPSSPDIRPPSSDIRPPARTSGPS